MRPRQESGGGTTSLTATVHPSSILRAPDAAAREREFTEFVPDLERVADELAESA